MTVIIDYGVGNLFSLTSSLASLGETVTVSRDADVIRSADRIILPGVGAFEDAAKKLRETGLVPVLEEQVKAKKPLLGICLGMQLLFEKSYEYGEHEGLGFIGGSVIPLAGAVGELKVPHMGWNALEFKRKHPLFKYVNEGDHVYFVHSYYAVGCEDSVVAVSEYGVAVTAAVAKDNVMGCQFHPEKSGEVGLKILKAFCEIK
ncbi:MAG: imidazole glycerol phosphate synthase subunit HisH [Clostridia bacterium]|nr:imidazole glycerol phosphate synthase subunit HisH [Clostridia bacterium]